MSEKVKLTREQAEAIEKIKGNQLKQIERLLTNPDDYEIIEWSKALLKLSAEEYYDALFEGYEVEETFKVGDCVVLSDGKIVEIIEEGSFTVVVGWITKKLMYKDQIEISKITRHATRQEKWWSEHGREVWELREDDILEYLGDLYIVDCFDSVRVSLKSGIMRKSNYAELFEFVKKHFKIVAFSEDRKDKGHETT